MLSEQLQTKLRYYKRLKTRNIDQLNVSKNFDNTNSFLFSHIRDLYPKFQYTDIAEHPAIVILPYQVSHFVSLHSCFIYFFRFHRK